MSYYDFQRYLEAKKTVDDRALNHGVWVEMSTTLLTLQEKEAIRVLEIGAGIGTMVDRLVERGVARRVSYLGVDTEQQNVLVAYQTLPARIARTGWSTTQLPASLLFEKEDRFCRVEFQVADIHTLLLLPEYQGAFDVLIAQAFLDLVDLSQVLPGLFKLLKPGGYFYFTINFDGETIFQPEVDPEFEKEVLRLYHQSMDDRVVNGKKAGHSQTGRRLFNALPTAGGILLAAGSSDWVVYPSNGMYPADEAYFLRHILHFFELTLQNHPNLDQDRFQNWLSARQAQVTQGKLVYLAHQFDFFGKIADV